MTIIDTIAAGLDGATAWTDPRGDRHLAASSGSRLVSVAPTGSGVRVSTWIDHGVDGRSWCDGRNYRTAAGALRFARAHLRTA